MASVSVTNEQPDRLATAKDYAALDFSALLTGRQVKVAEEHFLSIGVTRRLALAMLSKSKRDLVQAFGENCDIATVFMNEYDNLTGYIEHLDSHKKLMEVARTRMLCVLTTIETERPDIANTEVA